MLGKSPTAIAVSLLPLFAPLPSDGAEKDPLGQAVAGLELRPIGPALMGGRIADIAVDPRDESTWYLAVGSGGVWKTTNAGVTWKPIFDEQGSYSIGVVAIDPSAPDTVWVGTGENVSGRHVGWGDGVYKSLDGGKSWQRMGLPASEHIGEILVDPRDGDTVFVAAEGPLWSTGGERGLYRTADGGATWERVLYVDEDTGVTSIAFDPRDPDTVYAASYQRRRTVWSLLAGGPGSGIHKSTDGGTTWREVTKGLPEGDMGKIGLAVSPADPDVVYATIEADEENRGFYRSLDRGESWERRNDYISGGTGPHYYQEIVASPHDVDRVYQMDVFLHVTEDGGATFDYLGTGREKHSDNHALWIDPEDPEHLLAGTDASLFESFDHGATWRIVPNLPISQFYKLAVDDSEPFYNILGGAQDLGTLHGPSRTTSIEGIRNRDWYVPLGADGYGVAFEPENPDIMYMEMQVGRLHRVDRVSHEALDIQPLPEPGEPPERWNWDSPLLLSPHDAQRLYFGSQRLWRSDDRGDSWTVVSPDLTR
ncbi:MAG: glycosyl hydrolase, partial [Thermoanaerobaculia bacterium]|nr:glycosyl hydrolase [Thermoanaerobaculia bacterium]